MVIDLPCYMDGRKLDPQYKDHAWKASCIGPAFTAIDSDGKVICCAGIMIDKNGEGEAWALFSSLTRIHYRELYYRMKEVLNCVIDDLELKVIRQYFNITYPIEASFAGRFGFKDMGMIDRNLKLYMIQRD